MADTVFALATAPGRAAVAVVRISGPNAGAAALALAGGLPAPRAASLRRLRDPADGSLLDQALVLWFPAPGSFTGEDLVELHLHGGVAVVEAAMHALARLGLRLAEPGEFTRRAFEHGKLELTQAEAVADLVDAETSAQRRQALDQLGGALSGRYETWRRELLDALAWLEAEIDFPDEDLPEALAERAGAPLQRLATDLEAALQDGRGQRVRDGFRVALVGAPNAGKSTLINALTGRNAAIVTEVPGTTRDVIEVPLVVQGYRLLLADMAGVRDATDRIEAEGVRRARAWAETADLRLWVVDGASSEGDWPAAAGLVGAGDLLVLSKADLSAGADARASRDHAGTAGLEVIETSTEKPESLARLSARLGDLVRGRLMGADFPAATRLRHRTLLEAARGHLARGVERLSAGAPAELTAEDVRLAARALERLSGRIEPEALLDRVFASFCIGK